MKRRFHLCTSEIVSQKVKTITFVHQQSSFFVVCCVCASHCALLRWGFFILVFLLPLTLKKNAPVRRMNKSGAPTTKNNYKLASIFKHHD